MLRSLTFYLLLSPLGLAQLASAQTLLQQGASSNADLVDARAFALLFQRENAYLEQAKKAESQDKPATQLPLIMTRRLGLREEQRSDFEHLTQAWEADITPEIHELRQKLDGVTLQYRDRLRNSLPENDYQTLHDEALRATGTSLLSQDTLLSGGNQ